MCTNRFARANLYQFWAVGTIYPYELCSLKWWPRTINSDVDPLEPRKEEIYYLLIKLMYPRFELATGTHVQALMESARFYIDRSQLEESIEIIKALLCGNKFINSHESIQLSLWRTHE